MENNKKIAVIDDEECIQTPLGLRLRKLGYQVIQVMDGAQAIQTVRTQKPDLIILDLFLPHFSGEEICKAIREDEDESIASIPIIMVTAKDSTADRIVGKVIGANTYITKPFEFPELLKEIKHYLHADSDN